MTWQTSGDMNRRTARDGFSGEHAPEIVRREMNLIPGTISDFCVAEYGTEQLVDRVPAVVATLLCRRANVLAQVTWTGTPLFLQFGMVGWIGTTQQVVSGVVLTEHDAVVQRDRRDAPLVMVHGGCHGSWQWARWQAWFAERGWPSVAIDWFSHGDSAVLDETEWLPRDIAAVRAEVETACAAAQERFGAAPVVMGHSMGGLASLAFAASTSRDLAALVLLTPVVPRPYGGAAIDLDIDPGRPWGPPPPEVARQLFYSGVDDAAAAAHYQRLQPESPTAVWQATRWTADVDVTTVRAPVLVIAAEDDVLTPPEMVRALARGMGAARISLPRAGHGVTLDPGWPQLCERIDAWLQAVLEPEAA